MTHRFLLFLFENSERRVDQFQISSAAQSRLTGRNYTLAETIYGSDRHKIARWRFAILAAAAGTDLLDGHIARRLGSSRLGAFLDPVADKLFMACAFAVVAFSGRLEPFEIVGVLIRDIVATVAFAITYLSGRPASIPARIGGKAVTVGQCLTLAAFLLESAYLRPMAWATAAVGLYAIWDYQRVADRERRRV